MSPNQFDRYSISRKRPTFLYKTERHDESESEPVLVSVEGLVHKYGLSKKTARLVAIEIAHLAHKRWPRAYFVLSEAPHFATDTIKDIEPEDTEVIILRNGQLIPSKDIFDEGWETVKRTVQAALADAAIARVTRRESLKGRR